MRTWLRVGFLIGALCLTGAEANAGVFGPILPVGPDCAGSPLLGMSFANFYCETFESGALTVPGVSISAPGGFIIDTGSLVDSVEPLGGPTTGHDIFSGSGAAGVTFTFNPAGLGGQLPTAAGIVWTDGDGPNRTFTAFDASNSLIGTIIDTSACFFSSGCDGDQANYRLFYAVDPLGISSIHMANDGGGIEVDDLQFGVGVGVTPEPATLALLGVGLAGLAFSRRRRQN